MTSFLVLGQIFIILKLTMRSKCQDPNRLRQQSSRPSAPLFSVLNNWAAFRGLLLGRGIFFHNPQWICSPCLTNLKEEGRGLPLKVPISSGRLLQMEWYSEFFFSVSFEQKWLSLVNLVKFPYLTWGRSWGLVLLVASLTELLGTIYGEGEIPLRSLETLHIAFVVIHEVCFLKNFNR